MSGSREDLAVVVVNFNTGDFLTRCIRSVFAHAGDLELDVLIVDNASVDGSAHSATRAHPQARLISNAENRGLSAAWNQGAAETHSPWILFLNPDAEILAGDLATFVKIGEERPEAALLGPVVRNPDGSIYDSGRVFPTIAQALGHAFLGPFLPGNPFTRGYKQAGWDRLSEREVDWVSGSCMLIRRSAFEEVGRFDEAFWLYGEELDLSTRLGRSGWTVLYTPELEILHEGGVSTGRSRRMTLMHSMSIYRYFAKHRAAGWRRVLLPFAWAVLRLRAELVSAVQAFRSRS